MGRHKLTGKGPAGDSLDQSPAIWRPAALPFRDTPPNLLARYQIRRGVFDRARAECAEVLRHRHGRAGVILFDLDGTLLDHDAAERQGALAFAAAFGLEVSGFLERWREVSGWQLGRFLAGEIGFAEQRRLRVREMLGRALSDDEADQVSKVCLDAYENGWRLYPDVLPCLERLRGARLGVITNGNREQQLAKLESTSILSSFTPVVTSEDAGAAKPDPDIFRVACGWAGVLPAACTYVGDRLDIDAHAAARAGVRGIWLDRAASAADTPGVEVIWSLEEFHL